MNCRNCGAMLNQGAKFCRVCGTPVESDTAPMQKQKNNIGLKVIVVILVLLIIAILAGGVYVAVNTEFFGLMSEETIVDYEDKKIEDNSDDNSENDIEENEVVVDAIKGETADIADDEEYNEAEYELYDENTPQTHTVRYLYPSDKRIITESELNAMSQNEIALIRNEIYAKHGYIFQTEPYKSYFNAKEWYTPDPYFDVSEFNAIETANKDRIIEYESKMGWR